MADPKSAPAGSDKEPAASNPETGLIPAPADYQFSSRKARRHAELTGMIPIIVPKTSTEILPPEPTEAKHDADTQAGDKPANTVAGLAGVALIPLPAPPWALPQRLPQRLKVRT
ncbi:hypothetical protein [Arthrobacter polaris]|uniref:hypothetical protein n=1 Tax=Arthrobacter polaris TaxID=2813727 RepID=UPI001F17DA35|nr:hypothetical protein [Arthrobacter polaris]UIK89502.1 hypothetical protein J0916_03440 [Arthrobacter polaris]